MTIHSENISNSKSCTIIIDFQNGLTVPRDINMKTTIDVIVVSGKKE